MNTTLPASYYQADNERLEAEVQKLRAENRELKEKVKSQEWSIERYKNDMRDLEDRCGNQLRQIISLNHKLKTLRGEK